MKRMTEALRVMSVVSFGLFAWTVAAEMNYLPRLGEVAWLRWQVTLLAGVVFHASGERLAEFRCRCCGASRVLLRSLLGPARELLCHRCLCWDPSLERSTTSASLR